MGSMMGRGEEAVNDMRARLAAGWTVEQLWDRYVIATTGDGFTYDYASVSHAGVSPERGDVALQCA